MKRLFILFSILCSLAASAQVDSTSQPIDSAKLKVSITLPYYQHCMIVRCMNDWGAPVRQKYLNQLAAGLDTTLSKEDSSYWKQTIAVTPTSELVPQVFENMALQREATNSKINGEIEDALGPQIYQYTWIMSRIAAIKERNAQERTRMMEMGDQFVLQYKNL